MSRKLIDNLKCFFGYHKPVSIPKTGSYCDFKQSCKNCKTGLGIPQLKPESIPAPPKKTLKNVRKRIKEIEIGDRFRFSTNGIICKKNEKIDSRGWIGYTGEYDNIVFTNPERRVLIVSNHSSLERLRVCFGFRLNLN